MFGPKSPSDPQPTRKFEVVILPARAAVFPEIFGGLPASENPLMQQLLDPEERLGPGLQKLREHFVARQTEITSLPNSERKVSELEAQVTLARFIIELSSGGAALLAQLDNIDKAKRLEYSPEQRASFVRPNANSKFPLIQSHLLDIAFDKTVAEEVSEAAVVALQGTTEAKTLQRLQEYLRAPAEADILLAAQALRGTTDTKSLFALIDIATSLSSSRHVVETAQNSVRGTSNSEANARLMTLLEDPVYPIQISAARMLQQVTDEAVIDTLVGYLEGKKGARLQTAARVVLSENITPYARKELAALLKSAPIAIAEIASGLLGTRRDNLSDEAHLKILKSKEPERQLIGVKVLSTRHTMEIDVALAEL